jgi:hypothetical protein
MEKEIYFTPEMEVTEFECEDVIESSSAVVNIPPTSNELPAHSFGNWES